MKLLVSTKRGLSRRRRAYHDFAPEAQVVDCDALAKAWEAGLIADGGDPEESKRTGDDVAKAITKDDALNSTIVANDHELGAVPTLDAAAVVKMVEDGKAASAENAELKAEIAEMRAQLAKHAPSTGERERTASRK